MQSYCWCRGEHKARPHGAEVSTRPGPHGAEVSPWPESLEGSEPWASSAEGNFQPEEPKDKGEVQQRGSRKDTADRDVGGRGKSLENPTANPDPFSSPPAFPLCLGDSQEPVTVPLDQALFKEAQGLHPGLLSTMCPVPHFSWFPSYVSLAGSQ